MQKNRLEAFSDGVIAIIITIMVLEMKVPHTVSFAGLASLTHVFLSYVLSFVYVGIYWNNHHHMLHAVHKVNGKVLWANLHLLFWLSLLPFATGWMGENRFANATVALYGFVLLMCGIAYFILSVCLVKLHGKDSHISQALGTERKEKISLVMYMAGVLCAYFEPYVSVTLYALVALLWFVPDKRIERKLKD